MRPTRPAVLALIVLATALVVWALLLAAYDELPVLPWTAVPTLLLLGLGEIVTGVNVRARLRNPLPKPGEKPLKPMDPLVVARMAALGKATAHAAAALTGVFAGFLLYLSSNLDKSTPREDFVVSVGTAVSALALVGAALFLEYSCRVPKAPEDGDRYR